MDVLFGDYETHSIVNLKTQGGDVYARHPSTDVMAFAYAFDDGPILLNEYTSPPPQQVIDHVGNGGTFVAHNAPFEWLCWNYVWRRDFPALPPLRISQLVCTMARCYAMALPGSLEKAAAALGIDQQKDMKGNRVMLQLSQPKDFTKDGEPIWYCPIEFEEKYDQMYSYAKQDINVEREIFKRTLPLSKQEQEMWELDFRINQRGVAVDATSAQIAMEICDEEKKRLDKEMQNVTENMVATCNAHVALATWLRARDVPDVEGVGKADLADLLARENLADNVRRALLIRQEASRSATAKFSSLLLRGSFTHGRQPRLRSTAQYHGAGTGRWAGRGVQLQNLPRPKLSQKEIEGVFDVLN